MKIVKFLGGLGNQMFQPALSKSLQNLYPEERILADIFSYNASGLHNGFEVADIFNLSVEFATLKNVASVAWPFPNYRTWQIGSRILPQRRSMCIDLKNTDWDNPKYKYYEGYWQNEKFFKSIRPSLLDVFSFPLDDNIHNNKLLNDLTNTSSISIHIRRGDYIGNKLYQNICTSEYYRNAIEFVTSQLQAVEIACIFSNDMEWCKKNIPVLLPSGVDIRYVDWNTGINSFQDIHLMSKCNHNIIANSSFSWWGAWLNQNPNKIVVTPNKWTNNTIGENPICDSWNRVKIN